MTAASVFEVHAARFAAAVAVNQALASLPAVTLPDGSSVTGQIGLKNFDATRKFPGNVLKEHDISLNTPSGLAVIEYLPTYNAPPPVVPKQPTVITPNRINGGASIGDTIWATPGSYSDATGPLVTITVLRRNGVVLPGTHNSQATGIKTTDADVSATFDVLDTVTDVAGGKFFFKSSNSLTVLGATPTQPPPPSGLLLPSSWPFTVGPLLAHGVDPNLPLWDTAPGGSSVFGWMNNVNTVRGNAGLDSQGILHLKSPASGSGMTMTALPPKWGKGGAPVGLDYQSVVWRVVAQMAGSGTTGIGWDGIWDQCADWLWPKDGENDPWECSGGWNGGKGPIGSHYHWGGTTEDDPTGGRAYPALTDRMHELLYVRDCANGKWYTAVDGVPFVEDLLHESAVHFPILTAGQGSTAYPHEMLVQTCEFYGVA